MITMTRLPTPRTARLMNCKCNSSIAIFELRVIFCLLPEEARASALGECRAEIPSDKQTHELQETGGSAAVGASVPGCFGCTLVPYSSVGHMGGGAGWLASRCAVPCQDAPDGAAGSAWHGVGSSACGPGSHVSSAHRRLPRRISGGGVSGRGGEGMVEKEVGEGVLGLIGHMCQDVFV